jgi:hypothetical protein
VISTEHAELTKTFQTNYQQTTVEFARGRTAPIRKRKPLGNNFIGKPPEVLVMEDLRHKNKKGLPLAISTHPENPTNQFYRGYRGKTDFARHQLGANQGISNLRDLELTANWSKKPGMSNIERPKLEESKFSMIKGIDFG